MSDVRVKQEIATTIPGSEHEKGYTGFVELYVDTDAGGNYLVNGSIAGGSCLVYRVQKYESEGSRLFLRRVRSRKTKDVQAAEKLAMDWMNERIRGLATFHRE